MRIFRFIASIFYYIKTSYKINRIKRTLVDDLIYTTKKDVKISVYPGKKKESPYDFIVKYQEPGKRERTLAHVHPIIDMYIKLTVNKELTLKFKEHILKMLKALEPINYFPPKLQFFQPTHVEPFMEIDNIGDYSVEFLLVSTELMAIQEKTNYPKGSLTESLYENFGVKDRFSVIQKAVLKRMKS